MMKNVTSTKIATLCQKEYVWIELSQVMGASHEGICWDILSNIGLVMVKKWLTTVIVTISERSLDTGSAVELDGH